MSCHIKWISGICNLSVNMSNREHSCIECPVACVVADLTVPDFPWGYLKECLYRNHPHTIQEMKCVTKD